MARCKGLQRAMISTEEAANIINLYYNLYHYLNDGRWLYHYPF